MVHVGYHSDTICRTVMRILQAFRYPYNQVPCAGGVLEKKKSCRPMQCMLRDLCVNIVNKSTTVSSLDCVQLYFVMRQSCTSRTQIARFCMQATCTKCQSRHYLAKTAGRL